MNTKTRSVSAIVPSQSEAMPIRTMFDVATRSQAWGVEGYEIPVKYIDPMKQIKDREYSELREKNKLPTKEKRYVTKRGHFYNDLEKITKLVPAPNKYNVDHIWIKASEIEKGSKKPHNTKKPTYIDDIIDEQKKRPIPGPGKYNLMKTDEQLKKEINDMKSKKINTGEKVDFLCEYQYMSNILPGPGQYNPRQIQPKLQANRVKPDEWISKHKADDKKRGKSAMPDCGTYNPLIDHSFNQIQEEQKKSGTRPKSNYLGTEERFGGKKGKVAPFQAPGPGFYQMIPKWPGKEDGMKKDVKVKNWMQNISKGTQENRSIYY